MTSRNEHSSRRLRMSMWLAISAALLGMASVDGFDVVAGVLLVVVLVLTYLTGREIFARRDS